MVEGPQAAVAGYKVEENLSAVLTSSLFLYLESTH